MGSGASESVIGHSQYNLYATAVNKTMGGEGNNINITIIFYYLSHLQYKFNHMRPVERLALIKQPPRAYPSLSIPTQVFVFLHNIVHGSYTGSWLLRYRDLSTNGTSP